MCGAADVHVQCAYESYDNGLTINEKRHAVETLKNYLLLGGLDLPINTSSLLCKHSKSQASGESSFFD